MNLLIIPEIKNLLKIIYRFSCKKKVKLYLVGGFLRDIILKREKENPDIDFLLKKNSIDFSRHLAKKIKSGFVILDKERGYSRLVKRIKEKIYTLDFTNFRGKTLEEDLLRRDFTINTLTLELEKIFIPSSIKDLLIDPYGGRKDLDKKLIRAVSNFTFDEDPLRILRAFSLAAIFNFQIEKKTLRLIKQKKEKIAYVSFERIRDELFKILETDNAFHYLVKLDKLGILEIIFPPIKMMRGINQGPYHHLDVWQHTLETIRQLEKLIQETKRNKNIQNYLNEKISPDRRRRALIKLGALLHDIGKPLARKREGRKTKFHGHERIGLEITEQITQRLKLSNDEKEALEKMVYWHLRPGYLSEIKNISSRAKFRFFRDAEKEAVSILLISLADQRATRGPLTCDESRKNHERLSFNLIKEYFRKQKEKKLVRLITGDDLIQIFKLEPSPLIGEILSEVEELQAIGKIKTKKEALKVAKKIINKTSYKKKQ